MADIKHILAELAEIVKDLEAAMKKCEGLEDESEYGGAYIVLKDVLKDEDNVIGKLETLIAELKK